MILLTVADLLPFRPDIDQAKAGELIVDVVALARAAAPCIDDVMFPYKDAVKAILRQAVLRRDAQGTGAVTTLQETAGPLGMTQTIDTTQTAAGGAILWPSEIARIKDFCTQWKSGAPRRKAFTVVPR